MKIQNIETAKFDNHNTNFKSIKKLELHGLYKKNPEMGGKLIEVFKQNPDAMAFCKKYNVSVYFDAIKDGYNRIKSSLYIFYENPAENKIKRFFKFLNSSEDNIQIQGYDYDFKKSTNTLMDHMLPSNYSSMEGNATGVLSSKVKNVDEKIQSVLNKKAKKIASKLVKEKESAQRKEELLTETEKINASIKELIESTK